MIGKCCKGKDVERSDRDSVKALSAFTRKRRREHETVRVARPERTCMCAYVVYMYLCFQIRFKVAVVSVALI